MEDREKDYLLAHLPKKADWVNELEEQAKTDHIPIMDPIGMNFFMQLIRLNKPKRILEIGTAIGYSALRMNEACPDAEIVSIERDAVRYEQAVENIAKQGKKEQIQLVYGDALEELVHLKEKGETFQCVFIDAAKGQYKKFFELATPLVSENGFIVSDNVLFRGYVMDPEFEHPRYKKMVEKIRIYNKWLANHPKFITTILPIGDGIAISYRNQ